MNFIRVATSRVIASRVLGKVPQFTEVSNASCERNTEGGEDLCHTCKRELSMCFPSITCTGCNKRYCVLCFGWGGVACCLSGSPMCSTCSDANSKTEMFYRHTQPILEEGAVGKWHSRGVIGTNTRTAILKLDTNTIEFRWWTMEMRNNIPVNSDSTALSLVDRIDDRWTTPNTISLYARGAQVLIFEFDTESEHSKWVNGMREGVKLLSTQSSDVCRESQSVCGPNVLELRQKEREERKKKLVGENVGMKYTAEALMRRE
eukprot:GHVR01018738.1.p1 GENE.GHVR01018738.1~~GHVR01018738.1.p1  ORF type:complete len:261 (-),score=71.47 GHVR01018738.1:101-883(-)